MRRLCFILVLGCSGSGQMPPPPNMFPPRPDLGCVPGVLGCPCDATGSCGDGSFCNNSRVCSQSAAGCTPGELDCGCSGGGCNSGLKCASGVCRDNTGFAGGPCLDPLHCQAGNRCADGVCVQCTPGQQGCTCASGALCNETLACQDGICVASSGYALPTSADSTSSSCVTACSAGLTDATGYHPCSSEGLLDGCPSGLECMQGHCQDPAASPQPCTADVDCADYETCLDNDCRLNCDSDADCQSGAVCSRRVCRKTCDVSKNDCPDGLLCHALDGQSGVCLMRADGAPPSDSSQAATLSASVSTLRFAPSSLSRKFTITNGSPFEASVVLRRAHEEANNERTQMAETMDLLQRETSPPVKSDSCTSGTRGCRCGADSSAPCARLTPSYALTCESGLCALPACAAGSEGCYCSAGDCRELCEPGRCPLAWLQISVLIDGNSQPSISKATDVVLPFTIPARGSATITVEGPLQNGAWSGLLEFEANGNGANRQSLPLAYSQTPDGRWSGDMYYLGNFSFNKDVLQAWQSAPGTATDDVVQNLGNAFLRFWADFRRGHITYSDLAPVLSSTRSESWRTTPCTPAGTICYPTVNGPRSYSYTPSRDMVPGGVIQMPFAMTLAATSDDHMQFSGAVDSGVALQYPGAPEVDLQFQADPAACAMGSDGSCVAFLDGMSFSSVVGGRYLPAAGAGCAPGYRARQVPWLVPGWSGASQPNGTGSSSLTECRDGSAPFSTGDSPAARNADLAGANPLLDGKQPIRDIELLDGAFINSDTLVLLFSEVTPPLFAGQADSSAAAYGFMILRREDTPDESPVAAPLPPLAAPPPSAAPNVSCDSGLLLQIATAAGVSPKSLTAPVIAEALIDGVLATQSANQTLLTAQSDWQPNDGSHSEEVHYLCQDTRTFDATGQPCPADGRVSFFTTLPGQVVTGDPCQAAQTCDATLINWINQGLVLQQHPLWRCADGSSSCDGDRFDVRNGKVFYPTGSSAAVFLPLDLAVDDAFRYRTRFANRAGKNIGFVPDVCGDTQQAVPYCYAPGEIQELELRYNCLTQILLDSYDALAGQPAADGSDLQAKLVSVVRAGYSDRVDAGNNVIGPGFEMMRAELLVMLGDDAYTKALSSRFDLAGLSNANFDGTSFESGGINLSGIAGAEMRELYLATQYYELALDRLTALLPQIWRILVYKNTSSNPIIGQGFVIEFLGRVIRASSQKAVVAAEIGKHYQNLNRADLARSVIQRGYVAGYLESMELTALMRSVAAHIGNLADVPQIVSATTDAQLTYRSALNGMTEAFKSISSDVTYFGLPADYIPFPAVDGTPSSLTAFDVADGRAKEMVAIAQQAEDAALTTERSFDTDAASFESELSRIINTYDNQLSDICGTFTVDGVVYPATTRYAQLSAATATLGNPCGQMGSGQLAESLLNLQAQGKELERIQQQMSNVNAEVEIERERISAACQTEADWGMAVVDLNGQELTVNDQIRDLQLGMSIAQNVRQTVIESAQAVGNIMADNATTAAISAGVITATNAAYDVTAGILQSKTNDDEHKLEVLQNTESEVQFKFQCNGDGSGLLQIDSAAKVKDYLLQISELEIEASKQELVIAQAFAAAEQLANSAHRLSAQEDQSLQLAINVQAAIDDPNVRIYRNDAVIHADKTFQDALNQVYQATRVYEYYTSQSYGDKDQLFLARMVSRGDVNLQDYLIALEQSFHSFQDDAGLPDQRVLVMSLRDDILKIPYLDEKGAPLSTNDRVQRMQQKLSDPAHLDGNGYIVMPFRIGPELVSPLTRNHKLRVLSAQIVGGAGDQLGRVYVRMAGSAMVSTLSDDLQFLGFPQRTAVVDVFFSAKSPDLDPSVYQSNRFIDRPLLNSRWELVLNLKDEPVNLDFTVKDINDVRLFFYYSDFTKY